MAQSDAEWTEWARAHRAAYELAPLVEQQGGERLQVGFTLSLYAEAPAEGAEGSEACEKLEQEMEALAQDALPTEQRVAETEPDPERTVVVRPENELKPEVCLSWRIFHKDEYLRPVTDADRESIALFETRLRELGLKRGHW